MLIVLNVVNSEKINELTEQRYVRLKKSFLKNSIIQFVWCQVKLKYCV